MTTTAANLNTGDQVRVGRKIRTVLESEVLGELVRIRWSVAKDGDYEAFEEFPPVGKVFRLATV